MHNFLVYAYSSQDFAQTQEIFARSHDRETVTFRNSDIYIYLPASAQYIGKSTTLHLTFD